MHARLAEALLEHTGHDVSAVVSLDARGAVLDVCLFDTQMMAEYMRVAPGAAQALLICNHPAGDPDVTAEEIQNWRMLRATAGKIPVRLFVCSEYFPCREIAPDAEGTA